MYLLLMKKIELANCFNGCTIGRSKLDASSGIMFQAKVIIAVKSLRLAKPLGHAGMEVKVLFSRNGKVLKSLTSKLDRSGIANFADFVKIKYQNQNGRLGGDQA